MCGGKTINTHLRLLFSSLFRQEYPTLTCTVCSPCLPRNNNKGLENFVRSEGGNKALLHLKYIGVENNRLLVFIYEKLTLWEKCQITEKTSQSKSVSSKPDSDMSEN